MVAAAAGPWRAVFPGVFLTVEFDGWAAIAAQFEDYRAGATYDFALDEADRGNKKIAAPLLALWGARGEVGKWYDILAIWRDWADDVRGAPIDSGHFLAEEAPDETYAALREFFA